LLIVFMRSKSILVEFLVSFKIMSLQIGKI
jgi:hypothetical protein